MREVRTNYPSAKEIQNKSADEPGTTKAIKTFKKYVRFVRQRRTLLSSLCVREREGEPTSD